MGREQFFIAQDAIDVSDTVLKTQGDNTNLNSFQLSGYLGYIDSNFSLRSRLLVNDRVAHSNHAYVLYESTNNQNQIFANTTQPLGEITNQGVPILIEKDLYFVDSPAGILERHSIDGELLWSYDVGTFISAFDASDQLVVIGDLSGNITVLDHLGQFVGRYNAPGSKHDSIYGLKVSPSSNYIGVVGGLNPQRFILFRRGINGFTPIAHEKMDELRRNVAIFFDQNDKFVYYEGKNKIFIFQIADNVRDNTVREINLDNREFITFVPNLMTNLIAVASRVDDQQRLQIYSKDGSYLLASIPYLSNKDILLLKSTDAFLMGLDKTLMRVEWR
jgi:hypothetical protein